MALRSQTAQRAFDLVQTVISDLGYDLIDVEYKKEGPHYFLRFYIDRRGGVSTDDCEIISRTVDPILDEKLGVVPDFLEVSSPGLTRPLTTTADFLRHAGEEVEISLYHSIDGVKSFQGNIVSAEESSITILVGEREVCLPVEAVASVKRTIHF